MRYLVDIFWRGCLADAIINEGCGSIDVYGDEATRHEICVITVDARLTDSGGVRDRLMMGVYSYTNVSLYNALMVDLFFF